MNYQLSKEFDKSKAKQAKNMFILTLSSIG